MKKVETAGLLSVICAVILILMPIASLAAEEGLEYTVKKGDTLWDISSGKLQDPFLWPKLWKANPQIRNPHLIFPNEKVVIPAELLKEELRAEGRVKLETKRKLLTPGSLASKAVPIIPKRPIVDREMLLESGFFVKDVKPTGKIIGSPLEKTLLGDGDAVFISTKYKADPDNKFYIISKPEAILNPLKEKEIAGYHVIIKGVVTVTGDENGRTKAIINESYQEIHVGDMLVDYYPVSLPVEPAIVKKPQMSGVVLSAWNKRHTTGKDDVVYLNIGAAQGIEIGDLFTVTANTKVRPVLGVVQVFSISDAGSAALVKHSISEIKPGDAVGN